jgi:hypothetical protein
MTAFGVVGSVISVRLGCCLSSIVIHPQELNIAFQSERQNKESDDDDDDDREQKSEMLLFYR